MAVRAFIRKLDDNYTLCAFITALVLAIGCTLVYYPGVLYSDSYWRWDIATAIASGIKPGGGNLSFFPQLVMAVLLKLTGSYAAFTFCQCFAYLFTSLLLIRKIAKRYTFILAILFLVLPVTLSYSVFHEMSICCLAGLNIILLGILYVPPENWEKWKLALFAATVFAGACVCFGFRQNAFTVMPVILFCAIYGIWKKKDRLKNIVMLVAPLAGFIFVMAIPSLLGISVVQSSSAGFVWETLSTINTLAEDERAKYEDYFDDIAGEGATAQALALAEARGDTVNTFIWDALPHSVIGTDENSGPVLEKYWRMWREHPAEMLSTKWWIIERTMGLSKPIENREYKYDLNGVMSEYGMTGFENRKVLMSGFNKFMSSAAILRQPWILFLLAAALVIYQRIRKHEVGASLLLFACAVFYYGAFLVNTQSFEFRYFFPSFQLLFFVIVVGTIQVVCDLVQLVRKKRRAA